MPPGITPTCCAYWPFDAFALPKLRVILPDELPDLDTLAVVKRHLPWCSEGVMLRIAGRATKSPSFLKAIEDLADRARWLARKDARQTPTEADVLRAIEETLPELESMLSQATTPEPASLKSAAASRALGGKAAGNPRARGEVPPPCVETSADAETLPVNRLSKSPMGLVTTV
jgi:hypothetical protein